MPQNMLWMFVLEHKSGALRSEVVSRHVRYIDLFVLYRHYHALAGY